MPTPLSTSAVTRSRRFFAASALLLGAFACRDSSGPQGGPLPVISRITCTGSSSGISCAPEVESSQGRAPSGVLLDRIIGGQNTFVRLAQTSTSFNAGTNQMSSAVTVQNLTDQPMGTADGTTLDANAVRVFFHTDPTNGVTVLNEDGTGTFTGSNQEYFRYDAIIPSGATSSPETWTFQLPSPSTTFTFQVYVVAKQPNEAAPVDVAEVGVELLVSGLFSPVYLTSPPGDPRIFIVEQGGIIKIFKNGALNGPNFLNINPRVSAVGEGGLLSMAFHPNFATNGFFFVYITDLNGDIAIERYQTDPASDVATNVTPTPILTVPHPNHTNHNGGLVMFGPDGFLYAATGDGGGGGDLEGNAQNPAKNLGKLLRIDVSGPPFTVQQWAKGLRNPWRFDFHTVPSGRTDLYIADVGQNEYEEINVAAGNPSGLNYGWNIQEGNHCYPSGAPCATPGLHAPALEYDHSQGCSITGGFVYRGSAIPFLRGQYLYSDFCGAFLRSISGDPATGYSDNRWAFPPLGSIVSFGEDSAGELYVLAINGSIWKIVKK